MNTATSLSAQHREAASVPAEDAAPMAAIVQRAYGSTETLKLTRVRRPHPKAGEVLIEVHAAGVDRGVWHLMSGQPYLIRVAGFGLTRPKTPTPGFDVAGRVVAVGEGVTRFAAGDAVFGIARGAYAEYAVAKETKLAHKPDAISFELAAVAAISGITALQALTDVAGIQRGQSVLVIGAAGGVGSYAVQIARALGATVTGVASARKVAFVRDLGAHDVLAYDEVDYLDGSHRFDVIIDTGGRNPLSALRRALMPSGTLVIVGGEGGDRLTGGLSRQLRAKLLSPFVSHRLTTFISKEAREYIERLATLMEDGSVVPAVGARYPLEAVPSAIDDLAAGRTTGKSVIVVRDFD